MIKLSFVLMLCIPTLFFTSCKKADTVEATQPPSNYYGVKSVAELKSMLQSNVAPFNKLSTATVNTLLKNAVFADNHVLHGFSGPSNLNTELTNVELVQFYVDICGRSMNVLDANGNNILTSDQLKDVIVPLDVRPVPPGTTLQNYHWIGGNNCSYCGPGCTCIGL